jgi:hypothetical protein
MRTISKADMERKSRGAILTIFAICLGLMAVSNFLKPLKLSHSAGFVFFGIKLSGIANAIVGPIFGVILAVLVYGIFAMRRFALPLAWFYAGYVILNTLLFTLRHGITNVSLPLWILFVLVAVGVSSGTPIILTQRRAELV